MNDSMLSFTIILAQLGGVLFLILLAGLIFYFFKIKKEGNITRALVNQIKRVLPEQRAKLTEHFNKEYEMEQAKVDLNVDSLIRNEKKLYEHLVNVAIHKDTSQLHLTVKDINTLLNDYVRMLTMQGHVVADKQRDSRELQLRKENEALRMEVKSLENQLTTATQTIENMMSEYSSMYEGGKKEGEQRLKNEMYKLNQALSTEKARAKEEMKNLDTDDL